MPALDGLRPKDIIVNAHYMLRQKYKGRPLWGFIHDITHHGSAVSATICRECGWDPDQDASIAISKFSAPATEIKQS